MESPVDEPVVSVQVPVAGLYSSAVASFQFPDPPAISTSVWIEVFALGASLLMKHRPTDAGPFCSAPVVHHGRLERLARCIGDDEEAVVYALKSFPMNVAVTLGERPAN